MSPICGKFEHIIRNMKPCKLSHLVGFKEELCLIRREVAAQKISHEVLLGADVGDDRMELVQHHQVQELPEECSHGGVGGLLVGACQTHGHVVHKQFYSSSRPRRSPQPN